MLRPYLESDVAALAAAVEDIVEDFAGKTVLLGGGRGFLGRYFIALFDHLNRERLSRPCKLIVLDNLITTHEQGPEPPLSAHYVFLHRGNVACMGPRACYDESKRLGETLCYIYHGHHGVHTNTIRPFNVYGPGMPERDYRVLPNFASAVKGGASGHDLR